MQTLEILLTAKDIVGISLTVVSILIAFTLLILKIMKNQNDKLKEKLDTSLFLAHEKSNQDDFRIFDDMFSDVRKDLEKGRTDYTEIKVMLGRMDENIKFIKENCKERNC